MTMVCEDAIEKLEKQLIEKEEIVKTLESENERLRTLVSRRNTVAKDEDESESDVSRDVKPKRPRHKRGTRYSIKEDQMMYTYVYQMMLKGIAVKGMELQSLTTWDQMKKQSNINRSPESLKTRWVKLRRMGDELMKTSLTTGVKSYLRKAFLNQCCLDSDDTSAVDSDANFSNDSSC
ncbi:hypothetical protein CAEBREN_15311 [Caenorhabditis brenneri]|uniref:Uncharacterized protein n=1 Tax=Caenorhabditis brenneri TaxID=135651 RepID=G0P5L0_CAEBE|nr:hypothetical protein CAEBREN_15311 [Caenorhabditis brenneri]